ncbi:hypothetical protein OSTOST_01184 [Ostertagia ostertagi]
METERQRRGLASEEQVSEVNSLCNYIKTMHVFDDNGTPRYTAEELAGAVKKCELCDIKAHELAFDGNYENGTFCVKKEEPCE